MLLFSPGEASTFSYNNIFVFLSVSVFLFCRCELKVGLLHAAGPQYFGGVGSGLSKVCRSINIPLSDLNFELLCSSLKGKNGSFLLPRLSGFNVTVSKILIYDFALLELDVFLLPSALCWLPFAPEIPVQFPETVL